MFDLKKLQNTEIKSLNQISSQTVLLSQTVFTQKSRSDVILGRHYDCTPCTSYGLSCHATWDTVHSDALQVVAQQLPCQPENRCSREV